MVAPYVIRNDRSLSFMLETWQSEGISIRSTHGLHGNSNQTFALVKLVVRAGSNCRPSAFQAGRIPLLARIVRAFMSPSLPTGRPPGGCREHSYGGFGGGHPPIHPHTGFRKPT